MLKVLIVIQMKVTFGGNQIFSLLMKFLSKYLCVFLLLLSFISKAQLTDEQTLKIYDLKEVISTAKHDTIKINALIVWHLF